jgi:hypothetical protein
VRYAIVLLALSGCLISPIFTWGGGTSRKEAERKVFSEQTPPLLVAGVPLKGAVSDVPIRVWADDEYRAQNRRWQAAFGEHLTYVNQIVKPMLGIRLVAQYGDWKYRASPDAMLEDTLAALRQHDRGDAAFVVVGLTSALTLVSGSFEKLGLAEVGGTHVVVRGYADTEERKAFSKAFPSISVDERKQLLEMRRRHKMAALLLHELGHVFGAGHDGDDDFVMSPGYTHRIAAFSSRSRATMRANVDRRLGRQIPVDADAHPTLIVEVDAAGAVLVGGVPVGDSTLAELIRLSAEDDANTEVVIRADAAAPPAAVEGVMQRARAAGLERVTIAPR